jgi:hypothetical protein
MQMRDNYMFNHLLATNALDQKNQMTEEDLSILNKMRCHANNDDYKMTDYEALLCPAHIRGFALTEKRWAFFLVDEVEDILWSEHAFQKLELDTLIKENIKALVESHSIGQQSDGQISRKGKGLVVVLHGPPGTGKTLTAGKERLLCINDFVNICV